MDENDSEIDQKLMLECVKIATNKRAYFDYKHVTADAKDLYNFIKDDKLEVVIWLRDDEGNYLHTESHQMTYAELVEDYTRLKTKECSQEAIQAKSTANNSKPLDGNIKMPKSFFSLFRK